MTIILTKKQLIVLNMVKSGMSSQEIAEHLGISLETVYRHRKDIILNCNYYGYSVNKVTDLFEFKVREGIKIKTK